MKSSTNLSFLLLIGLVGTIITGIGEFLLHFNPMGYAGWIGGFLLFQYGVFSSRFFSKRRLRRK